ncbi:hypothetical protein [Patiriisocius hiemis]|uniref:Uncharacterized protein n=1 Tax=Patiriisocius hiemis TaxID=3075604 RepID=A0ABU2YAQ2_9FLAO|nr:hypothetical protein [Constantimarinum sp. W242]MDT0554714.1 hypothetical protein [Constantimarinum sp. W242]
MINSLKYNRQQLGNHRSLFDKENIVTKSSYGKLEKHRELSMFDEVSLEKKLYKYKREQKRRRVKLILGTIVVLVLLIILFPFLVGFIFDDNHITNTIPNL